MLVAHVASQQLIFKWRWELELIMALNALAHDTYSPPLALFLPLSLTINLSPVPPSLGIIMTAVADLDRETQDRYELVVKATDMAGQMGGLSGSTTVTIVITDVNDNPPRFPQSECLRQILLL